MTRSITADLYVRQARPAMGLLHSTRLAADYDE